MASTERRRGLLQTLAWVLLGGAALLGTLLLGWLSPATAAQFAAHGDALVAEGATTMRELLSEQTDQSGDLLVDLIRRTTVARERALADLPLEASGGDLVAIRSAVVADDAARSAQQQKNVVVLAGEMLRRAELSLHGRMRALEARQRARTGEFAAALRQQHLWLVVATTLGLFVVLTFGLHRLVIRPVRRLRQATQQLAAGALHVDLPPASSDELGDLTRDFATMVAQLQDARHRLEQSAAGLADEVKRQTAHLEQALADLRTSQGQLAAAERLAALGTLAGGVAHEFRNVIGGIRGCANELLAEAADADQRETLAVITRAADRGSGIVQQLLRFARPAVERTTTVDPSTVVADALRLCEPAARQQQIQVERDLPPGPAVALDADGVHQVCVNLMLNALAAMTAGGTLRVMVQHHDDHTAIAIADTGCGIAAADLPHLFEPFFTTRGTAVDPARRGTGLGLSVSHGIVRGHGGRIEVQSAPGVGSTFTVRLPRQH